MRQEPVEEGLLECRTRKLPKKAAPAAARQYDVEFARLTQQYPRTRAEAQLQARASPWPYPYPFPYPYPYPYPYLPTPAPYAPQTYPYP